MEFLLADYITSIFIFFGAILYSSVGHGGASSYIAIMSVMGTPVSSIKPIGLVLNIIVSSVGSYRFIKNKLFSYKVFLPLVIGSVPAAFLGGYIDLSSEFYRPLVGVVLLFAGFQFLFNIFKNLKTKSIKQCNPYVAILDDGDGMTDQMLAKNVVLGSTNPTEVRDKNDLGRFGLGLKTASFSEKAAGCNAPVRIIVFPSISFNQLAVSTMPSVLWVIKICSASHSSTA